MRTIILVIIIAIVAIIGAIATGFLNISQVREAKAPQIAATQNGVVSKGGQAPAFDVATGSVKIGTKSANVKVPAVEVEKPANQQQAATNNAQ